MRLIYLHGFASSPQSSKAQFFRKKFLEKNVTIQIPPLDAGDFEHLTITSQLRVVEQAVAGQPAVLMGSSLGGYLATLFAARHPQLVERLVLMAPAFSFPTQFRARYTPQQLEAWRAQGASPVFHYGYKEDRMLGYGLMDDAQQYENEPATACPALIFHGRQDSVVPVDFSQTYAARHPNVTLQIFESGHELTDVLEPMWTSTEAFLFRNLST